MARTYCPHCPYLAMLPRDPALLTPSQRDGELPMWSSERGEGGDGERSRSAERRALRRQHRGCQSVIQIIGADKM
jgi:hypothetical protein